MTFSWMVSGQVSHPDTVSKFDREGKKQGYWEKYDEAGLLKYEGRFVDDIPAGEFRYYYPDGKLKTISHYSDMGKCALTVTYHRNGNKMAQGKYYEMLKDSLWQYFDEDGMLISEENYKNGLKNGVSRTFYFDGQLAEETHWSENKKEGPSKQFYGDGSLKLDAAYKEDQKEGLCIMYYPNRQLLLTGSYAHNKRVGDWTYFLEDGTRQRVSTYVDGFLVSEVIYVDVEEEFQKIDE